MVALAAAACGGDAKVVEGQGDGSAPAAACRVVRKGVPLPAEVGESSGLAAGRRQPGVYWTHNDSGGEPEVFALDAAGALLGRVRVAGASNRDWEDAATGPCPGGACLYLADAGNNSAPRRQREPVLWRIPEPAPADSVSAPAARFTASFPRGAPDVEAAFVLPDGGVYLITKGSREPVELYRWPTPLRAGASQPLVHIRQLMPHPEQPGDRVTGASAAPNGRWVAVRTYSTLAFYRTTQLLGGGGPAFTMDLTPLGEGQGEAVSLADDGSVLLTSEGSSRPLPGTAALLACTLP